MSRAVRASAGTAARTLEPLRRPYRREVRQLRMADRRVELAVVPCAAQPGPPPARPAGPSCQGPVVAVFSAGPAGPKFSLCRAHLCRVQWAGIGRGKRFGRGTAPTAARHDRSGRGAGCPGGGAVTSRRRGRAVHEPSSLLGESPLQAGDLTSGRDPTAASVRCTLLPVDPGVAVPGPGADEGLDLAQQPPRAPAGSAGTAGRAAAPAGRPPPSARCSLR